jgi:hypothetical protein
MKKNLLFILLIGFLTRASSQNISYGNEWINYSQSYFKFKIIDDGLYRITYEALNNSGVPISTINGSNFSVFNKGKEIPLYVTNSGILGPGDYLEFYAVHNDGAWDSTLYADKSWQSNNHLSLFNDTASYFLTWGNLPALQHITAVSNNIINHPPAATYCWYNSIYVFGKERSSYYNLSRGDLALSGQSFYDSDFSNTEGYTDLYFNKTSKDYAISTPYPYLAGPVSRLKCAISGWGITDHAVTISMNGSQFYDSTIFNFNVRIVDKPAVTPSVLTSPSSTLTFSSAASTSSTTDYNAVAWIEFRYPREFNFDNSSKLLFTLDPTSSNQYVEINNFNENGTTPVLYDFTNKLRLEAIVQNDTEKFLLPPSAVEPQLLLIAYDPSSIKEIDTLKQVHFTDFSAAVNQGDFIIITHPYFLIDSTGHNYVEDYRQYKNGNGYSALNVNIFDLYDQFAFGIQDHPASIRKFTDYIMDHWPVADRHMMLIGKAIEYGAFFDNPNVRSYDYVPTFGFPGSDVLLTAKGFSPVPRIPIGRLACLDPGEIGIYLDKAELYTGAQTNPFQTIANKAWMKNVMHLAGGSSVEDQATFAAYLNKYKGIIEDTLFGGDVVSFFKTSTDPIEYIVSSYLDSIISSGVSLINFYGHSSYNSFDFNLDRPEEYNNYGKYPVIVTNGCLIGNLFTATHGLSDDFIFAKDRGAIAFLAPSQFSVSTSLDLYTTNLYRNTSIYHYNESIGQIIAATMGDVYAQSYADIDKATAEQMLLDGDPSLKINMHAKPDYVLEPQEISFDPQTITSGLDSFFLQVVVYNIGKAVNDSIYLDVKRTLPNGTEEFLYHKRMKGTYFIDTIRLSIKTEPSLAFGLNQFKIKIDAGDSISAAGEIEELSELNNEISANLLITSDDIVPAFPYEFSIVSEQGVTLKASTVNAFAASHQYVFQIDTTENFNSPMLQQKKIVQPGGVIKWTPQLTLSDSVVYYWRTSVDTLYGNQFTWHNSSFIYIQGSSTGWNQSHYFQFTKDNFTNVELSSARTFQYIDDIKTVGLYDGITSWIGGPLPLDDPGWFLNGVRMSRVWECMGYGATVIFEVIDSLTGIPWINPNTGGSGGLYNTIQCKATPRYNFFYPTSTPYNPDVGNFLDTVPDGDYILMMTINDANIRNWDTTMKSYFTDLGLTKINTINTTVPYVFFLKKNDFSYPVYEVVGDTFNSIIDTNFAITGNWDRGYVESPLIGPAASWSSLHWKVHGMEAGADSISVSVSGVDVNGVETLLFPNVMANDTSLSGVDVIKYPFLKLKLYTVDTTNRTPVQLDYWRINYQPVPEAALNPAVFFSASDTVNQFLPLKISVAIENLTPWNMDSLLMKYQITDAVNGTHIYTRRYKPLAGNDTIHTDYNFETGSDIYAGLNYLYLEANPDNDQPEQYHFNNVAIRSFHVNTDELNPLLDVTFDGIHILDGDLVSAKPDIEVQLKDESKFLALDDTSLFDIYFIYPDGSKHLVNFDNVTAIFVPADAGNIAKNNTAHVTLKKSFNTDGIYQLVVQGFDKSGNASGDNFYKISFEVINKPMISNVLNYPNPFSTSTRFVFTLTGSIVPQQMKIQIMTISGKVIKEVFSNELGNIHIGNNITDYAWDGTDQFGDRLANGLYFYRVTAILDGINMDHYGTSTDDYFKKGIGKMYLMH